MFRPTIYKRPHVYKSNVQKRYSVYKGLGVYKLPYGTPQDYTKYNVPVGVQILHDFGDGLGPVPAVPVDNAGIRNEIIKVNAYELHNDNAGVRNVIMKVNTYELHNDNTGIRDEIVDILEVN